MALRTDSREIDGKTWDVTTLPSSVGMDVAGTLLRLVAPAVEKGLAALGSRDEGGELLDLDVSSLGPALGALFSGLGNPGDLAAIKRLLVSGKTPEGADYVPLRCDGKVVTPSLFETLFAGEYLTLLKVAKFAAEVNFKVPFASLQSAAAGVLGKIKGRTSRRAPSSEPK